MEKKALWTLKRALTRPCWHHDLRLPDSRITELSPFFKSGSWGQENPSTRSRLSTNLSPLPAVRKPYCLCGPALLLIAWSAGGAPTSARLMLSELVWDRTNCDNRLSWGSLFDEGDRERPQNDSCSQELSRWCGMVSIYHEVPTGDVCSSYRYFTFLNF